MTAGRVLVVGDLATDVVTRTAGPVAPHTDTAAQIRITGGGAGANAAAWLAHVGVPVTLVARVGDDDLGRCRVADLRAAGVTCAVGVSAGGSTGVVVVLVGPDGERTMLPDRGANALLRPEDVIETLAGAPDVVHLHLSGYILLDAGSRAAGLTALGAARAAGLSVSVDAASAAPLVLAGPAAFLGWVRGVDLLLANAAEAAVLAAGAGPTRAAEELCTVAGAVVVKDGPRGAVWQDATGAWQVDAAEPSSLLDTTGAGDAFAAGLLAAWLSGVSPHAALREASTLAADAVAALGGWPLSPR